MLMRQIITQMMKHFQWITFQLPKTDAATRKGISRHPWGWQEVSVRGPQKRRCLYFVHLDVTW